MRTIADALNQSNIVRGMLNELDKLVQVYLTYPVTSATAERSFSSLRRIKTFLRSSMTAQRLNNLFILYVHKSFIDLRDFVSVNILSVNDFVSVNTRRINYFGHFKVNYHSSLILSILLLSTLFAILMKNVLKNYSQFSEM